MARIIGLDVHRTFAEVAVQEHGRVRHAGRILTTVPALQLFARGRTRRDHVVLEATCNTHAIARLLRAHAGRVVVSNPRQTRVIAEAKIKTDKIDAAVLIQLHASGFLPEVWMPDEGTEALRRQVSRRAQIVRHRTRLKNQIHAILHRNLVPRCPASDLFGQKGRAWLATQPLPPDERAAVTSLLRALDHGDEDLTELDRDLAGAVLDDAAARRLMTIPGVDFAVAVGLIAAIGDVSRFRSAQKLVSYFGLNPRVRQSGLQPAQHGRITKQGRAHARGMLVEAAWAAAKTPGPLRAFFARVCARRGRQIAAVATARKLAVLAWHLLTKRQDYAWARPSLTEQKRRKLELERGRPLTAASVGGPMRTTSRRCELGSGPSASTQSAPTRRSSRTGDPSPGNGARAPPTRRDVDAHEARPARRGFQPHAPLFGRGHPCPGPFYRRLSVTRTAA